MVRVDLKTGLPSSMGVVVEAFKAGTEPGTGYKARGDGFGTPGADSEEDPNDPASAGNQPNWGLY